MRRLLRPRCVRSLFPLPRPPNPVDEANNFLLISASFPYCPWHSSPGRKCGVGCTYRDTDARTRRRGGGGGGGGGQNQVVAKVVMKKAELAEHIDLIRGAVMICFPMGLPEWDNVRLAIEDTEELEGSAVRDLPPLSSP